MFHQITLGGNSRKRDAFVLTKIIRVIRKKFNTINFYVKFRGVDKSSFSYHETYSIKQNKPKRHTGLVSGYGVNSSQYAEK